VYELEKLRTQLEELIEKRTNELKKKNEQLQQENIKRERIEKALRESEEKFSTAFRWGGQLISIHTLDGRCMDVSESCK
jgi:C4-dicarboxylate-specific signal transduction histidine kinase